MKVTNPFGAVCEVPGDWTEEVLREKGLTVLVDQPLGVISQEKCEPKIEKTRRKRKLEALPLKRLKALARERGIHIGRSGRETLIRKLKEEG